LHHLLSTQSALNAILKTPNVLYDALTGQPCRTGRGLVLLSFVFAVAPFPAAFAPTVFSFRPVEGPGL